MFRCLFLFPHFILFFIFFIQFIGRPNIIPKRLYKELFSISQTSLTFL